jgi:hypothetical protein
LVEPQGDNKQLFQQQIKDYYNAIKQSNQASGGAQTSCSGALFFAVKVMDTSIDSELYSTKYVGFR